MLYFITFHCSYEEDGRTKILVAGGVGSSMEGENIVLGSVELMDWGKMKNNRMKEWRYTVQVI